jgi:hypothetical protein
MILALLCLAQDIGAVPLADAPLKLLDGRLTARFPAEAVVEPRSRGIMAASASDERETRVVWTSGARKIVIMVYEQLETAGDDFPGEIRGVVKAWDEARPDAFTAAAFPLEGLRACGVTPAAIDPEREAVFIFGLFTATRDRAVQYLAVYANPEAAKDAAGCAALARRIAGTVAPGGRELVVAAGRRALHEVEGRRLTVELPEGFVATSQKGPDFRVTSMAKLVPIGRPRPVLGVYVGRHPRLHRERAEMPGPAVEEPGAHLGKDVIWQLWSEKGTRYAEAILPLPDSRELLLHVWVSAPDVDGLKALRESLRTSRLEAVK